MPKPFVRVPLFAIAALPVLVFLLHRLLVTRLGVPDLPLGAEIVMPGKPHLEAAGRTRFLAAFWIFALFTIVAVATFVDSVSRPLTPRSRLLSVVVLALIITPVAASVLDHQTDPESWRGYFQLGRGVYEAALGQGIVSGCGAPDDRWLLGACGDAPALEILRHMLDAVNLLSAVSVGSVVVAMILCLRSLPDSAPLDARVALLKEGQACMRRHLYLSGLILTSGMALALAWLHWPLPLIDKAWKAEFEIVLRAVEFLTGTYFSMLILSYFLPVAVVMEHRARRLSLEAAGDTEDTEAWRKDRGLGLDTLQLLKDGLAVAAPVLTAFAGGFSPLG